MKQTRLLSALLAVCLAMVLLAGCAGNPAPSSEGAPASAPDASAASAQQGIHVTDMMGREIVLEAPATRIVAVAPSAFEILFALGAGDAIVGRGTYCDYPEGTEDIPVVESGQGLNVEQIMALEPDVVLMATMDQTTQQVQALQDAGTQVVVSDAQTIDGVYQSIQMIGDVVGKSQQAESLVTQMETAFTSLSEKAAQQPAASEGKTVYFEISPLEYGLWTAGSGTFMDEIAHMLGLVNAFAEVDGWAEISQEQVIERDPDYIITVVMYPGEEDKQVQEVLGRPGWENLKAVQNGTVFSADNNQFTRPGPRLVEGATALYQFVYGDTQAQAAA